MLNKIMSYALTLVAADPENHPLSVQILETFGINGEIIWLAQDIAYDVIINAPVSILDMQQFRDLLAPFKIDIFCTALKNRRKKLLLADMDSTIVIGETLDDLADFANVKPEVEEITARAMRGEMDFHDALNERVALLKNLPTSALEETYQDIQIMPGAKELIGTMTHHDARAVLVTGGFTYFADKIGEEVGFNHVHGNQLEITENKLSGAVIPPILDKEAKLTYIKQYTAKYNLDVSETMAIGDGANDLPMLETAGLGIGYHPKPILQERLLNVILHGDLSAALYAQGYKTHL